MLSREHEAGARLLHVLAQPRRRTSSALAAQRIARHSDHARPSGLLLQLRRGSYEHARALGGRRAASGGGKSHGAGSCAARRPGSPTFARGCAYQNPRSFWDSLALEVRLCLLDGPAWWFSMKLIDVCRGVSTLARSFASWNSFHLAFAGSDALHRNCVSRPRMHLIRVLSTPSARVRQSPQ